MSSSCSLPSEKSPIYLFIYIGTDQLSHSWERQKATSRLNVLFILPTLNKDHPCRSESRPFSNHRANREGNTWKSIAVERNTLLF